MSWKIKSKLVLRVDNIKNEELTKKYYEDIEKIISEEKFHKNSDWDRQFTFLNVKETLNEFLFPDQIFNLNFIKNIIESDDKFITALNFY